MDHANPQGLGLKRPAKSLVIEINIAFIRGI